MKIDERVYWFDGNGLEYTTVHTGVISAIERDNYQVFSHKKPNFVTINKHAVFSEKQLNKRIEQRRKQWAEEYIKKAIKEATEKAKCNVTIGHHTFKLRQEK